MIRGSRCYAILPMHFPPDVTPQRTGKETWIRRYSDSNGRRSHDRLSVQHGYWVLDYTAHTLPTLTSTPAQMSTEVQSNIESKYITFISSLPVNSILAELLFFLRIFIVLVMSHRVASALEHKVDRPTQLSWQSKCTSAYLDNINSYHLNHLPLMVHYNVFITHFQSSSSIIMPINIWSTGTPKTHT